MNDSLARLSIVEASKKLASGEISSVDLVRACLIEIQKQNPELNAYLEVFEDAEEQAKAADARRAAGESNPLLGIPLAVKDNILIEGKKASAASKMLENYVATYDATAIAKLKKAGAVFIGRTNMDEFAMGGSTENSAFGPTKNPHDTTRVSGGTSGGSAAAVAAGMALGALGSDTGGSVRNPASFCGVVGMKPTYGAVSRFGLIAAVSSFDQIGPITKTAEDAELIFNCIRGKDVLDSTSFDFPRTDLGSGSLRSDLRKSIGVPRGLLSSGVDADVLEKFEASLKKLEGEGYEIVDIELKSAQLALAAYYITNFAEVSSNLSRFDGVRYGLSEKGGTLVEDYAKSRGAGFGKEVRRRIMLGAYVLSAGYYDAYYGKAGLARTQLTQEFASVLEGVSCIATPTMPTPAFRVGEKEDPLAMYAADLFTVMANLTGNPAISIPAGSVERDGKSLPVGIQYTAAHGNEAALFAVGKSVLSEIK
jgi:aspartyl-tRNA(Asn)/glutamyl-tRNA(Gln) amidotransferase subunit A